MPSRKSITAKNSTQAPVILIAAGLLLMVVAVIILLSGQSASLASNTPTPLPATPDEAKTASALASVERTTPADAYSALQNDAAIIIDVRSAAEYAQAHIAGAINIPYNEIASRIKELDPAKSIITYCT